MDVLALRKCQPIYIGEMMERLGIEPAGGVVRRLSLSYATVSAEIVGYQGVRMEPDDPPTLSEKLAAMGRTLLVYISVA